MTVDTRAGEGWDQQPRHPRAAGTSVPKTQLVGGQAECLSWGTAEGLDGASGNCSQLGGANRINFNQEL